MQIIIYYIIKSIIKLKQILSLPTAVKLSTEFIGNLWSEKIGSHKVQG